MRGEGAEDRGNVKDVGVRSHWAPRPRSWLRGRALELSPCITDRGWEGFGNLQRGQEHGEGPNFVVNNQCYY